MESWTSREQPPIWISILLPSELLTREEVARALVILADFLQEPVRPVIALHLNQPATDWSALTSRIKLLRETLSHPGEVEIRLIAPFGEFHESEMTELFNLGLRVRFSAGWIPGFPPDQALKVNVEVLRSFSELGFRTPIEWYVHAGNITAFEEQIPEWLIANYNSGFSLPLTSEHPGYGFGPEFPRLPEAYEYCQMLVRNYQRYPYYDDVLSPLTMLAVLHKVGGWHARLNIPTIVNFLMDAEGQVGFFRHSPTLASTWTSIPEILSLPADALRQSFLDSIRHQWSWDNVPYCRECRWRYTCGGLGVSTDGRHRVADLDTMCAHRKLFLEHFGIARTTDFAFGLTEKAAENTSAANLGH